METLKIKVSKFNEVSPDEIERLIKLGGLVLISGFIFVVFLIEYLRYQILTGGMSGKIWEFIKVYPYLITAVEIFMFLWAYNIISWYRSRTAFFALIVLAVMMLIPRKVMGNRLVFPIIIASTILGGFLIPVAYVYIGSRVIIATSCIVWNWQINSCIQLATS